MWWRWEFSSALCRSRPSSIGFYLLVGLTFPGRRTARRLIRQAQISVVVRRAAYDRNREYEQLVGR